MMVDTGVLWTFLLLWLVIVPTPGANSLLVTHLALSRPPAHVAFAIIGNIGGILLLGACALLGWAAVLEAFPWLRLAVHVLGGLYLVYFGWRLLDRARHGPPIASMATTANELHAATEPLKAIALGFVTALSNAQAILFITGIFAVSGVLSANVMTGVGVLAIMALCNATYLGFLGWMFQRERVRVLYQRSRHWFEGTMGIVFVFFGARLIWREAIRMALAR